VQAVRNFVQLCLEGYYDGTIFHRIIKDYLVQGGDPTGSGTGSGDRDLQRWVLLEGCCCLPCMAGWLATMAGLLLLLLLW
jgi:hypothetical protein